MNTIIKFSLFLLPNITFAQSGGLSDIFVVLIRLINNSIIPLIIGIGLITFIWGIIKYVITDSESGKKDATSIIVYGLIALFVMVCVWGLVSVLQNTFRISNPGIPKNPQSQESLRP